MDPYELWRAPLLRSHIERLLGKIGLLNALSLELEAIAARRSEEERVPGEIVDQDLVNGDERKGALYTLLSGRVNNNFGELNHAENAALRAARELVCEVEMLATPLEGFSEGTASWEQLSGASKIRDRRMKVVRNRKRRQKLRREAAIFRNKAHERYEELEQKADEWRAQELAKDHAKRKMEKMQVVAEKKARVERRQLEKELETALLVEKLQELRTLRIQKLKKQGAFFPEEDNEFLERVRAATEEEEQRALQAPEAVDAADPRDLSTSRMDEASTSSGKQLPLKTTDGPMTDARKDLPDEFYRYYYGSCLDIGTLIAVRRSWDNYLSAHGGSKIPGHWVTPSPPSDDVWASYSALRSGNPRVG